jgi:hypothetical protein
VLDQLARGCRQGCHIPLGKSDADNELLVLAVAQLQQTIPQADHRWRRPPRRRQRPNFDGVHALFRADIGGERPTAHQEHDERDRPLRIRWVETYPSHLSLGINLIQPYSFARQRPTLAQLLLSAGRHKYALVHN